MNKFAGITALATYLPEKRESNIDLIGEVKTKKLGIIERTVAEKGETPGDMAYKAAERLFAAYPNVAKSDIRFVLLCIEHPDHTIPNTACHLAARLGLSMDCGAVDYHLGCSGYIYGLAMAKGLIETGASPNVLLLTCAKPSDYTNKRDLSIRPIMSDGAAATLIESCAADGELLHSFVFGTDGENYRQYYIPAGGARNMPQETPLEFTTDDYGNTRSNYDISMDGRGIFYFAMHFVPQMVEDILAKANLTRRDLDYCVFHQPNGYLLKELQKKCRVTDVPFYQGIEHIGNTGSNTVPIGLLDVLKENRPEDLQKVMLTGFGVGLSMGGCIADLSRFQTPVTS